MNAADEIRNFIEPLLQPAGWRIQFGRWRDDGMSSRYAVLRPVGGLPAELVRQPQFTLLLIGSGSDDGTVPATAAEAVIEAMRVSSGTLVFMQPSEPVFWATDDERPVSEIAISAITN